jgi:hypothetical protein
LISGIIIVPSRCLQKPAEHPSPSLVTTQSLVNLFQYAIRAGHEEILSWLYYSNGFENKVAEICRDTGATDKTARSQLCKEMLVHLPGITSGNLRTRAKNPYVIWEGVVRIDKLSKLLCHIEPYY